MKREFLLGALALVFIQYGCLKEPDYEKLSSNLVVATIADSVADFSSYRTYFISDSVAVVNGTAVDTILKDENTQKMVDAVKQNMNARGYVFAPKADSPELGITLGIAKNTYVGVVYSIPVGGILIMAGGIHGIGAGIILTIIRMLPITPSLPGPSSVP
jgi:hypothetical protein